MRNPLARYYDWAMKPRLSYIGRLYLIAPVGASLTLIFLLAWAVRRGVVRDATSIYALWGLALALVAIWLGYVAYRLLCDAFAAARWMKREMGPDWRGGWRAAWRTFTGRSGKSG